ncbi:MAG: hypothetical protein ABSF83_14135 [Nitrososphaerales archaeon]
MSKIISGTLLTVVAGFAVSFSFQLLKVSQQIDNVSSFFGSAASMMYLCVEGVFLATVLFGAYAVLRKRN